MIKLLYILFRKQFNQYVFEGQGKRAPLTDCKFAFIGAKGHRYFEPIELVKISIPRYAEFLQYIGELEAGLSRREFRQFKEHMKGAVNEKINKGETPDLGMVMLILNEFDMREEKTLPQDVLYSLLATYYIREDEDPATVDQEIHDEKIKEFKENIDVLGFFLSNDTMTELLGLQITSPIQLDKLLKDSEIRTNQVNKLLNKYSSQSESLKKTKTLESTS